jgi:hypothetical protein
MKLPNLLILIKHNIMLQKMEFPGAGEVRVGSVNFLFGAEGQARNHGAASRQAATSHTPIT